MLLLRQTILFSWTSQTFRASVSSWTVCWQHWMHWHITYQRFSIGFKSGERKDLSLTSVSSSSVKFLHILVLVNTWRACGPRYWMTHCQICYAGWCKQCNIHHHVLCGNLLPCMKRVVMPLYCPPISPHTRRDGFLIGHIMWWPMSWYLAHEFKVASHAIFVTFAFFSGIFVTLGSFCMCSLTLLCSHCRCEVVWLCGVTLWLFWVKLYQFVVLYYLVSLYSCFLTLTLIHQWVYQPQRANMSYNLRSLHSVLLFCFRFKKCNISARWDSISLHSAPTNRFSTGTNKGRTPKDDVQKTYVVLNRWAIQPHYYSVESYCVAPFNGRNIISCFWSGRALEKDS